MSAELDYPSIPSPFSLTTTAASTPLSLLDRVAIITGSCQGIGKAISLHLASHGAKVVINYPSPTLKPLAEQVVSEINSLSISSTSSTLRAISVQADISEETQVKSLFDIAEQSFGTQPHIVVANSGVFEGSTPLCDMELSDFDRVFSVNARGTFLTIREAARRIKQGGGGRIITLSSSILGSLDENFGTYAASKAAVEAMTKVLAKELKGTRITANCVAPGPILTDMLFDGINDEMRQQLIDVCPLGRLGKVEDVARVVGFLVSDAGEWINGQSIRVNGGYI